MARKRILSTLDTSIAYEAVGLDLAKTDVALAAFDSDPRACGALRGRDAFRCSGVAPLREVSPD